VRIPEVYRGVTIALVMHKQPER